MFGINATEHQSHKDSHAAFVQAAMSYRAAGDTIAHNPPADQEKALKKIKNERERNRRLRRDGTRVSMKEISITGVLYHAREC